MMATKECPLGFRDKQEWKQFCDALARQILASVGGPPNFQRGLKDTTARFIRGFTIIASGSATTLWSENPDKHNRRFDEVRWGNSDIDVAVVFDNGSQDAKGAPIPVDRLSVQDMFFGKPPRSHFSMTQYAGSQCRKRFQLEPRPGTGWLAGWRHALGGRDIGLVFARNCTIWYIHRALLSETSQICKA